MATVSKLKGIAFPFRKGSLSFPEQNQNYETLIDSVRSVLYIGKDEVPFSDGLGTSIHDYVFGEITPITKALIAKEVRNVIALYVPQLTVIGIDIENKPNSASIRMVITYSLKGEVSEFPIKLNRVL